MSAKITHSHDDAFSANRCPLCEGRGSFIHGGGMAASFMECPVCHGKGEVILPPDACPHCGGSGFMFSSRNMGTLSLLDKNPCPQCAGTGKRRG